MFIRRLEQFSPTDDNLRELEGVVEAVQWLYMVKKLQQKGHLDETGKVSSQGESTHNL